MKQRERDNVRRLQYKHQVWKLRYPGYYMKKRSSPDAATSTTTESSFMEEKIRTNFSRQRNQEWCLVHICQNNNSSLLVGFHLEEYVRVLAPRRRQSIDDKIKNIAARKQSFACLLNAATDRRWLCPMLTGLSVTNRPVFVRCVRSGMTASQQAIHGTIGWYLNVSWEERDSIRGEPIP